MQICFKCFGRRVQEKGGRLIICTECAGDGILQCCGGERFELPEDHPLIGTIIAPRDVLDGLEKEEG